MSYKDLRSYIQALEKDKEVLYIKQEVDSDQELAVIHEHFIESGGPALVFENVKNSSYRVATNLFGTLKRVRKIFGGDPAQTGERIVKIAKNALSPNLVNLWHARKDLYKLLNVRTVKTKNGPVLDYEYDPPNIDTLPVLKCWPLDGGRFFTLPLVHTTDPETGAGNTGIYRMQLYDANSTGMHWQIEKGGGFHFKKACELNKPLPVSVILGGPPALTLAAITALPEGADERLLASWIMGKPIPVIKRKQTGHLIPANAEFVLEGTVTPGDIRKEGPFGDHFGHYSHSADFPVFRVSRMLARKDAIYPATLVGKPPQEDYYIGIALQEMTLPILRFMHPGILDLWAYPDTGFHPLAVASIKERYPKEALKYAFSILGLGQLSLTKVLIITNGSCGNVRDITNVSKSLWQNLNERDGVHLIAPAAQDTLDFTGPAMNSGSRLILIATSPDTTGKRQTPPPLPPPLLEVGVNKYKVANIGEAFLVAQVSGNFDIKLVQEALQRHPVCKQYLFHILISDDVKITDKNMVLWSWFTRFDPLVDMHPSEREIAGNRMILKFPILINAVWKQGYPMPLEYDKAIEDSAKLKLEKIIKAHNE